MRANAVFAWVCTIVHRWQENSRTRVYLSWQTVICFAFSHTYVHTSRWLHICTWVATTCGHANAPHVIIPKPDEDVQDEQSRLTSAAPRGNPTRNPVTAFFLGESSATMNPPLGNRIRGPSAYHPLRITLLQFHVILPRNSGDQIAVVPNASCED